MLSNQQEYNYNVMDILKFEEPLPERLNFIFRHHSTQQAAKEIEQIDLSHLREEGYFDEIFS